MDYEWEKITEDDATANEPEHTGFTMGEVTAHESLNQTRTNDAGGSEPAYTAAEPAQDPGRDDKPERKPKKSNHVIKKFLVALGCVVLFGAAAGAAFFGIPKLAGIGSSNGSSGSDVPTLPESNTIEAVTGEATTEEGTTADTSNMGTVAVDDYGNANTLDVSDLVEATMPSLVQVTNIEMVDTSTYENSGYYYFFGGQSGSTQKAQESLGSGVIVGKSDTELFIVTNAHVVEDADELVINFYDDESADAYVKGSDEDVDIALMAVKLSDLKQSTVDAIKIATFGDSTQAKIGQSVIAIGNAMGYGQSVTAGIISAVNRSFSTSSALLIQTDAAINPGNSGGALFNMKGELIGINNSKVATTTVEGMGYAIPSSVVEPLVEEYKEAVVREKVADEDASYIGISGIDVSETLSSYYGIPEGIYISQITEGGPCEAAGIPEKAVITKFDGKSVSTMTELKELLTYYAKGEQVVLTVQVYENGSYEAHEYTITLGSAVEAGLSSDNQSNQERNYPGYYQQDDSTEG